MAITIGDLKKALDMYQDNAEVVLLRRDSVWDHKGAVVVEYIFDAIEIEQRAQLKQQGTSGVRGSGRYA